MDIDEQVADPSVQAGLGRAGAVVKDVADKAREKLAGYREGGLDQVSADIVDYTRRQPVTAILIAAGVGLLVGMLLRPGRGE
jgi:ElaB/YqjD/DUF883 family membrane-anchored ribosome-binding protein